MDLGNSNFWGCTKQAVFQENWCRRDDMFFGARKIAACAHRWIHVSFRWTHISPRWKDVSFRGNPVSFLWAHVSLSWTTFHLSENTFPLGEIKFHLGEITFPLVKKHRWSGIKTWSMGAREKNRIGAKFCDLSKIQIHTKNAHPKIQISQIKNHVFSHEKVLFSAKISNFIP